MTHHSTLVKPDASLDPDQLIDQAIVKFTWYLSYTEHQLNLAYQSNPEVARQPPLTETLLLRKQAYEAIKSLLHGMII